MALIIMVNEATTIREQTNRRPFPLRISDRERERDSSIFSAARKYGSDWIGQVILIGENVRRLTVKLNYTPHKNFNFLSGTDMP